MHSENQASGARETMTPRPPATNDDVSAKHFLDAAAKLIDAMFVTSSDQRPRRLNAIDFPATLEWLRIEDVIRIAQTAQPEGASRKAFHNRWKSKEDFVNDAVIHTMLYRDAPNADPALQLAEMSQLVEADSAADAIARFSDDMLSSLLSYPRSFLLLHIGPLLNQHPRLKQAILDDMHRALAPWCDGYARILEVLGLSLRRGWTIERLGLTLQAMLDGFLLRSRVQEEDMVACEHDESRLFGDAVVAFVLGVVDVGNAGQTARQALDVALSSSVEPNEATFGGSHSPGSVVGGLSLPPKIIDRSRWAP
ncbi:hypothetical protein AB0E69_23405 [Kribbella sp. NPDC026611]|uniref:hypothetical protein n=1 Tax=Kribbella sp. NPDC026611 TaxID=3154911 RepID=UPI0034110B02